MSDFEVVTIDAKPVIYVSRTSSDQPAEISQAMGSGFGTLGAFAAERGLQIQGMPLSIYHGFSGGMATFDVAMFISPSQLADAEGGGEVKLGNTPGGKVVKAVHKGPYNGLGNTYNKIMEFMKSQSMEPGGPCYEIYVDDPGSTPEAELRTEIYFPVKG